MSSNLTQVVTTGKYVSSTSRNTFLSFSTAVGGASKVLQISFGTTASFGGQNASCETRFFSVLFVQEFAFI